MAYHYTGCGLDWVWLENGFRVEDTPYGRGVAIAHADALHTAIIRTLITRMLPIRGQELRYIRSWLDMTQKELGAMLGVKRETIVRLEAERDKPVTGTMAMALRSYLGLRFDDREVVETVERLVRKAENDRLGDRHFTDTAAGWREAA